MNISKIKITTTKQVKQTRFHKCFISPILDKFKKTPNIHQNEMWGGNN